MIKGFTGSIPLVLLLLATMSVSILPSHATSPTYLPAVAPGKGAEYKELYYKCQPQSALACTLYGNPLGSLDYALLHVVSVLGASVTLSLVSVYKNGTASRQGALVNVDSGVSNVSFAGVVTGSELLIAGGLKAPEPIWNNLGAPTINQTTSLYIGANRTVNILNTTSVRSVSVGIFQEKLTTTAWLAFDQQYGLLVEGTVHVSGTGISEFTADAALGMVDNDLWLSSSVLNFALVANPTLISSIPGSSATSAISLIRTAGFTGAVTVTLQNLPSAITCSLNPAKFVTGADVSSLSCSGPPGSYPVTVKGDSGFSVNSVNVTLTVGDFTVSSESLFSFQSGTPGQTGITVAGFSGFSGSINLSVISDPTGLTCSLDHSSVTDGGSVMVTCDGQPGTYTVTVNGTSGTDSHSTKIRALVTPAPLTLAGALGSPPVILTLGAAVVVIVGLVSLYLRRKQGRASSTPRPR
jgi:hypothetical protein